MTDRLALVRHEVAAVLSSMWRRPFVPLLAIAMLTLGIGANVAVFTVISRSILRPLRYRRPDRLLAVITSYIQPDHTEVDEPTNDLAYVQWKLRSTTFTDLQAVKPLGMTIGGTGDPESVQGAMISGGLFRLFGVRPVVGRDFTREDDVPKANTLILSYGLWQRRFAGNANVLTRTVVVDGKPYMVIGVMPRDFEIPTITADLFIPEGLGPSYMPNPRSWNYSVFGRLRDGVTPQEARAELRRIATQLQREFPDSEKSKTATVKSLREAMYGDRRDGFLVLWLAVVLVQILACVNVANLMLAKMNDQRGVTALRLVLGANRWQLVRVRLIEGLFITLAGALFGYGLAAAAVRIVAGNQPDLATPVESGWTIFLFVAATVLFTALVVSGVPALKETGMNLSAILSEGSQRASSSRRGTRARELFVIAQVALAVPLLLSAMSAVSRFREIQRVDLGFDADHVLTSQLIMPARYDKAGRAAFARELVRRLQAIPGVTGAAVTTNLWQRGQTAGTFAGTDRSPELVSMASRRISPEYFSVMKIRLQSGRVFTDQDVLDSPQVAIVSEALAKRFWPGETAIGKTIRRSPPNKPMTVVGVAPDVHDEGLSRDVGPALYMPVMQNNSIYVSIVMRTAGDPMSVRDAARRAVWSLDRNLSPALEKPLRALVDETVDPERLQATLLSAFAFVAFLLATIGIYAVTSYSVSQRTREIGVRLAFGATPRSISADVLRQTARCVAAGLALGLLVAVIAERVRLLVAYGAPSLDIRVALSVCTILFATSLVAGFIPSLRSRYVTPTILLRDA